MLYKTTPTEIEIYPHFKYCDIVDTLYITYRATSSLYIDSRVKQ